MRIGKLRHTIEIQRKELVPDGGGGYTEEWVTVKAVMAGIEPLRGKELYEAQQTQAEITHRIRLRYIPGITPDMRVNFKGRIFQIVSPPINEYERNRDMQLMCVELFT